MITYFTEIYKVRNSINLVLYLNGDLVDSFVVIPSDEDNDDINNTIERIKNKLTELKISYQIYR